MNLRSSGGRTRLPTWVVRIRLSLRRMDGMLVRMDKWAASRGVRFAKRGACHGANRGIDRRTEARAQGAQHHLRGDRQAACGERSERQADVRAEGVHALAP